MELDVFDAGSGKHKSIEEKVNYYRERQTTAGLGLKMYIET